MDHRRPRGGGGPLPDAEGCTSQEENGDRATNEGAPRQKGALREAAWSVGGRVHLPGVVLAEDFSLLIRCRRLHVGRDGSVSLLN